MPSSHLNFDRDQLALALVELAEQTAGAARTHAQATPTIPPTAAGRDFHATAARLQEALSRVHQVGQRRIDALHEITQAGTQQVDEFVHADEDFANTLRVELP